MQRCYRARRPGKALHPIRGILSLTLLLASAGCAAAQDGLVHHPDRGVYSVEYVDDYGATRAGTAGPTVHYPASVEWLGVHTE